MLGSPKSNLYVSIAEDHSAAHDDDKYRRLQYSWLLSVEPHRVHIPGTSHRRHEPIHYSARLDKHSRTYSINSTPAERHPSVIIGNILIAEMVKGSAESVHATLNRKLTAEPSVLPSEQTSEDDPEHWIRKALHVLQSDELIRKFDVGEFMTFAHAYAVRREAPEQPAPAMVAYPKLSTDHEKKAQTNHFWIRYSMKAKPVSRNRVAGD